MAKKYKKEKVRKSKIFAFIIFILIFFTLFSLIQAGYDENNNSNAETTGMSIQEIGDNEIQENPELEIKDIENNEIQENPELETQENINEETQKTTPDLEQQTQSISGETQELSIYIEVVDSQESVNESENKENNDLVIFEENGNWTENNNTNETGGTEDNESLGIVYYSPNSTIEAENDTEDNKPPEIVSYSPNSKIFTDTVTLNITTNKPAECKYESKYTITESVESDNKSYEDMSDTFSTTDTTRRIHSKILLNLKDGIYYFYIRCKDEHEHINLEDQIVSFSVDSPPTAIVELEDSVSVDGLTMIKDGLIKVFLTTSEDVQNVPSLTYSLDYSAPKEIIFSGSNSGPSRFWQGYMKIDVANKEQLGRFYFQGVDLTGHQGEKISSGKLFVADTRKPSKPIISTTSEEDGYIELEFYYDGNDDDFNHYNIYRSSRPGVGYTDLYREDETDEYYIDKSVEEGRTYYYTVSAVDDVGNEGKMSDEVLAKSVINRTTEKKSVLSKKSKDKIINLTETITDLINKVNSINLKSDDSEEQEIIDELGKQEIEDGKEELDKLKREAKNLEFRELDDSQLDREIKKITNNIETIKKSIPGDITIEETGIEQLIKRDDIETAINELKTDMAEKDKEEYIKDNEKLGNKIQINVNIKFITLKYLDNAEKQKTLIKKQFSSEEELNNIDIIEIIPKIIAESVDDIEIKTSEYEIIKRDPIIKWTFELVNGNSIEYLIDKEIDIKDIKRIRTASLQKNEKENKTIFTSLSVLSKKTKGIISPLTILITIIAILSIVFLNYHFSQNRKKDDMNTVTNVNSSNSNDIYDLLNKAHSYMDNGHLELARTSYNLISITLRQRNLDYEEKMILYGRAIELYNKIILFLKTESQ